MHPCRYWPEGAWSEKQVSGWSRSGADAPCSPDEDDCDSDKPRIGPTRRRGSGIFSLALSLALAVPLLGPWPQRGQARDVGQYAGANPEMKAWFDGLKSGKGPCCSDADGTAVSDVDWQSASGHYRVRLDGEWVDVPDEAVITQPNRIGRTMVWPLHGYLGLTIRCFMPGSMT
jgi:hypothetical protein